MSDPPEFQGILYSSNFVCYRQNWTFSTGTLHITQYQKAPTFAVSCESLNTTLPEKERLL